MFTNLCLILLLLLVGSLQFRNFTFNYRKKADFEGITLAVGSSTAVAEKDELFFLKYQGGEIHMSSAEGLKAKMPFSSVFGHCFPNGKNVVT